MENNQASSGVQELITRLSEEGVEKGQRQAEQLVAAARASAEAMVADAHRKADEIEEGARQAAEQTRVAGEDALRLACRDAINELASQIHDHFRQRLQRLITHTLQDDKLLKRMILEVAGKAAPPASTPLQLLLPAEIIGDEQVRSQLETGNLDPLTDFVRDLTGDAIREGIQIGAAPDGTHGLQIRVVDEKVQIELTDETLTQVIADHVLPRFRGLLRQS